MTTFNPDSALRYHPVIKSIRKHFPEYKQLDILEVGSGSAGLTEYLDVSITGLDNDFEATSSIDSPTVKKVIGSVTDIPFKANSFDVVLSLDMMEHIPGSDRPKALEEMFRVARPGGKIYCGMPVGPKSREFDAKLNNKFNKKFNKNHPWLIEHIENGLPSMEELNKIVAGLGASKWSVISNVNHRAWYLMHHLTTLRQPSHYLNKAIYPIYKHLNFGSTYRKIFEITK